MSIKYSIVNRRNPIDPTAPGKYYPSMKANGRVDLKEIATLVGQISGIKSPATMGVVEALLFVIPQALAEGNIVDLGDFGSYRLTLRASGEADSKDVSSKNILEVKVNFVPGKRFRQALSGVSYRKEEKT